MAAGDDRLWDKRGGDNYVYGEAGNDDIVVGVDANGENRVNGGTGNDSINANGSSAWNLLNGGWQRYDRGAWDPTRSLAAETTTRSTLAAATTPLRRETAKT